MNVMLLLYCDAEESPHQIMFTTTIVHESTKDANMHAGRARALCLYHAFVGVVLRMCGLLIQLLSSQPSSLLSMAHGLLISFKSPPKHLPLSHAFTSSYYASHAL